MPVLDDFKAIKHVLTHVSTFIKADNTKWAVACDFQQFNILTRVDLDEPVQHPFKLRNSIWCSVSSLTAIEYSSDKQGSDQTARMRRLIWGFAGRTYHIVGNLIHWLKLLYTAFWHLAEKISLILL